MHFVKSSILFIALVSSSAGKNLGESCDSNTDCLQIKWGLCDLSLPSPVCVCESDRVPVAKTNDCIKITERVGGSCSTTSSQCVGLNGSFCSESRTCDCNQGSHVVDPHMRRCLPKVDNLGEPCKDSVQCQVALSECSAKNGEAGFSCQCITSHVQPMKDVWTLDNRCIPIQSQLGGTCDYDIQCTTGMGTLTHCNSTTNVCQCNTRNSNIIEYEGKCYYSQRRFGDSCQVYVQCLAPNAACVYDYSSKISKCDCPYGFVRVGVGSNQRCAPVRVIGDICNTNGDCSDVIEGDTVCDEETKTCACGQGFIQGNEGNRCYAGSQEPGWRCEESSQCKGFLDGGIFCNTRNFCECIQGYVWDKDMKTCAKLNI